MKRLRLSLLSVVWLWAVGGLHAQVVFGPDDQPVPGDMWVNATDTSVTSVNVGMPGANQTWDISPGLESDMVQTQYFVDPDTTPWAASFPTSNLAVGFPGLGYNYLSVLSDRVLSLGFAGQDPTVDTNIAFVIAFDDPQTLAVLPAQMGVSFVDTSSFTFTIAGDGLNFDSVLIKSVSIDSVEYDGWGTLTTPNGVYNTLRSHRRTTQIDSVWVYLFGTSFLVDDAVSQYHTWEWLAPDIKGPAATVTLDAEGYWSASWTMLPPPPEAQFTYQDMGNGLFQFTDQSTNNPDNWLWDFGDGTNSTEQNPMHTYTEPGTYTVCLVASNSTGADTACMDVTVVLPPMAAFTFTDEGAGTFSFVDQSTNNPDSWLWDFGDGTTSMEQNPTHTFTASGDYTVCLAVSNSAGADTACQTITVVVTGLTEAWSQLNLDLFPNPVSQELRLRIDWPEPLQFVLHDALGRQVRARTFVQTATIGASDLPQGTYIYTLRTTDGQLVARGQILVVH